MIAVSYPFHIYGYTPLGDFDIRGCQGHHHYPFDQEFPLGQKTPTVLNR